MPPRRSLHPHGLLASFQPHPFWCALDYGRDTLSRHAPRGFSAHAFYIGKSHRLHARCTAEDSEYRRPNLVHQNLQSVPASELSRF